LWHDARKTEWRSQNTRSLLGSDSVNIFRFNIRGPRSVSNLVSLDSWEMIYHGLKFWFSSFNSSLEYFYSVWWYAVGCSFSIFCTY
jgi:hypothetical protein